MRLLRIRTGAIVARRREDGLLWESAIGKIPASAVVTVRQTGIEGDHQADKRFHGGVDKAILLYNSAHYRQWSLEYGEAAPPAGTLGENFEVAGASEETVCIGDVYRAGEVTIEISQPRQPCWKPAALHSLPGLTARILKTGRTGWYARVLAGGQAEAPSDWHLIHRPNPEWTVARATAVCHFSRDPAEREALAANPELSAAWKDELRRK